jgi:16S rRNA (guanine527-N7)-methyltransferase
VKHRGTSPSVNNRVREILEATPEVAACGKVCLERIGRFAEVLGVWGERTNLTAHPGDPVEVAFHVIDSLAPLFLEPDLFHGKARVIDLGSGAGFPGLILAAATDSEFTLIEGRRKRASFLSVAVTDMDLTNVRVVCDRVVAANVPREFDVLTSRAVGEPSIEVAGKALRLGGAAILWASPEQAIDPELCRAAGFGDMIRREYIVNRGSRATRRALLIFKKSF